MCLLVGLQQRKNLIGVVAVLMDDLVVGGKSYNEGVACYGELKCFEGRTKGHRVEMSMFSNWF